MYSLPHCPAKPLRRFGNRIPGARFLLLQERPLQVDRRPLENPFIYIHFVSSIIIRQTFPEHLFEAIIPAFLMGIVNDANHFKIRTSFFSPFEHSHQAHEPHLSMQAGNMRRCSIH
jgi:hypothetical protein